MFIIQFVADEKYKFRLSFSFFLGHWLSKFSYSLTYSCLSKSNFHPPFNRCASIEFALNEQSVNWIMAGTLPKAFAYTKKNIEGKEEKNKEREKGRDK